MRPRAIRFVSSILLVSGCSVFGPHDCTVVGCPYENGLRVEFLGSPDDSFVLTATSFAGVTRTLDCTATCDLTQFGDFSPGRVTIRYESESRTIDHAFEPDYERFRPNGPDCGPVCAYATVQFDLGAEG